MFTIFKREMNAYFTSLVGWLFLTIFYCLCGALLFITAINGVGSMGTIFTFLFYVLLVLIPLLTMRLMSDERRQKTDQLLLTAPVRLGALVMGKFLAAFCMLLLGVAMTFIIAIVLSTVTEGFDWLTVIGNILGIILLGGAMIAIGLFVSSITESQVIAAVLTFSILLGAFVLETVSGLVPSWLSALFAPFKMMGNYAGFTMGLFGLKSILYFLSVMGVGLFGAVKVLEKRRWS